MAHSLAHPNSDSLFHRCLAASAAFHIGLMLAGGLSLSFDMVSPSNGLVIDLTLPLREVASPGMGPVGLPPTAPPLAIAPPAVAAPVQPIPVEEPAIAAEPAPLAISEPEPAETAAVEAPADTPVLSHETPTPATPAAGVSPLGLPGGEGTAAGSPVLGPEGGGGTTPAGRTATPDVMPSLLNKKEVLKNLRRFYPEPERLAGREAQVVVKILIGRSGRVESVDVIRSGGAAFDAGAIAVAERMRFSPAMMQGSPVAVALPQLIIFKLE